MGVLAKRMSAVKASPIIVVAAQARALKASGLDVVSLSIGVPGFTPPAHVYAAAKAAVDADAGDYLAGRGSAELVEAFRLSLQARGFSYGEKELCAQVGGKGALFNLFLALLNPGDEVVIPAPYWTSYPEMVKIVGAEPVTPLAGPEQAYKLTPQQLAQSLGPKVKMVVFNNPSNPTGMLYSAAEVAELAKILAAREDIWILSDDIYDRLVYPAGGEEVAPGARAAHLLDTQPGLRERLVIVQSVSKTYGMPGWRVGLVAAPEKVIEALMTLTSQSFTNLPGVAMAAAAAALSGPQGFLEGQKARLLKQRDITLAVLKDMGLSCPVPEGAFYAFPHIHTLYGKVSADGRAITDDVSFCEALLHEALVAVVPGGAFGDNGAVRISYAGKEAALVEGLSRMAKFVAGLV